MCVWILKFSMHSRMEKPQRWAMFDVVLIYMDIFVHKMKWLRSDLWKHFVCNQARGFLFSMYTFNSYSLKNLSRFAITIRAIGLLACLLACLIPCLLVFYPAPTHPPPAYRTCIFIRILFSICTILFEQRVLTWERPKRILMASIFIRKEFKAFRVEEQTFVLENEEIALVCARRKLIWSLCIILNTVSSKIKWNTWF